MPINKRIEIMLPLTYNNGQMIEPQKLYDLKDEIVKKFKGASMDDATINGTWIAPDGVAYYDKCKKLFVDIEDTPENGEWLKEYKEKLKVELKQIEVYITSYKIEIL